MPKTPESLTIPVYMRIGENGSELHVGSVFVDLTGNDFTQEHLNIAGLLRQVADEIDIKVKDQESESLNG